ncbi:MAG: hypothetical protein ACKVQW_14280 [Pyrinomonadaceae bacterium]
MSNSEKACTVVSACCLMENGEKRDDLFKDNWEVFVIRQDTKTGKFDWFTECCERIVNRFRRREKPVTTAGAI